MGRFSRSQNKQQTAESAKQQGSVRSLFATNAEPSREALAELFKQLGGTLTMEGEAADVLPETVAGSRSRSNTITSERSKRSITSKKSVSEASSASSHTQSIPGTPNGRFSTSERPGPPAMSVRSHSASLLRRPASRMNLLAAGGLEGVQAFLGDPSLEKSPITARADDSRRSPARSKREKLRQNISAPFGFLHLTHTDQHHVDVLNRTRKTDLVSEFSAIRAGQKAGTELKGIHARDISTSTTTPALPTPVPENPLVVDSLVSSTATEPLPQEDRAYVPPATDVRLSRSLENFSRPIPRSPQSPVSPQPSPDPSHPSQLRQSLAPAVDSGTILQPPSFNLSAAEPAPAATVDEEDVIKAMKNKPLPQLPTVVHAISTKDESALPLPSAPLPRLLEEVDGLPKSNSAVSLRRQSQHAPLRHMQSFPSTKSSRRQSRGLRPDSIVATTSTGETSIDTCDARTSTLALLQKLNEESPEPTRPHRQSKMSPVNMDDWDAVIDSAWDQEIPADAMEVQNVMDRSSDPDEDLGVLGNRTYKSLSVDCTVPQTIDATHILPPPSLARPLSSNNDSADLPSSLGLGLRACDRVPSMIIEEPEPPCPKRISSSVSNDSSRDSFMMSIASSIIGTNRSSTSSITFGEFGHIARFEDFVRTEPSKDGKSSQETIRQGTEACEVPSVTSYAIAESNAAFTSSKHERLTALPPCAIPVRKSSVMTTPERARASRNRSSTIGSRTRLMTRSSYSLFPTTQTVAST